MRIEKISRETARAIMYVAWQCEGEEGEILDTIQDLMEEYGEEHGLPEGWWMEEVDVQDIYDITVKSDLKRSINEHFNNLIK